MIGFARLQNNGVLLRDDAQFYPFIQLLQIHIIDTNFIANRNVVGSMIRLVISFKGHRNLYDSFFLNLRQIYVKFSHIFRQNDLTFRRCLWKICLVNIDFGIIELCLFLIPVELIIFLVAPAALDYHFIDRISLRIHFRTSVLIYLLNRLTVRIQLYRACTVEHRQALILRFKSEIRIFYSKNWRAVFRIARIIHASGCIDDDIGNLIQRKLRFLLQHDLCIRRRVAFRTYYDE